MIVENPTNVKRQGMFGEKQFTIKANAKMHELIIAGLYSNKIGAVVREVCSNAYDIHKKVGKSHVPFKVWIPTSLEPHFIVRDEGTGLSPEEVEKYYATIGESSKETSNFEIGGFGLGAKSPFAYTDNFQIESRFNGMKYHFTTMKDEDGIPCLLRISEAPTDEGNGLTIKIPVKRDDYERFAQELVSQLVGFDVKPEVVNEPERVRWENIEYLNLSFDTETVKTVSRLDYNSSIWINMGGVVYPVKPEEIDEKIRNGIFALNTPILIKADVGDCLVTPSRESLEYKKKTVDKLNEVLSAFIDNCKKSFIEEISRAESLYSVVRIYKKYHAQSYHFYNEIGKAGVYWNGQTLYLDKLMNRVVIAYSDDIKELVGYATESKNGLGVSLAQGEAVRRKGIQVTLKDLEHVLFVIDDGQKHLRAKLRNIILNWESGIGRIFIVSEFKELDTILREYMTEDEIREKVAHARDLEYDKPQRVSYKRGTGITVNGVEVDDLPELDDEEAKESFYALSYRGKLPNNFVYANSISENSIVLNGHAKKYASKLEAAGVLPMDVWLENKLTRQKEILSQGTYPRDLAKKRFLSSYYWDNRWIGRCDKDIQDVFKFRELEEIVSSGDWMMKGKSQEERQAILSGSVSIFSDEEIAVFKSEVLEEYSVEISLMEKMKLFKSLPIPYGHQREYNELVRNQIKLLTGEIAPTNEDSAQESKPALVLVA